MQNDPEKTKLIDHISSLEAQIKIKTNLTAENEALFAKIQSLNS